MSRQLKVEGEAGRLLTIQKNAVRVAENIASYTNHKAGYFALVIKAEMVPPEWADAAFALDARRHDFGFGENAFSIWIFPVHMAARINAKFPMLIAALERQRQPIHNTVYRLGHAQRMPAGEMAYA